MVLGWLINDCICPEPNVPGWSISLCECCPPAEPEPTPPVIRSVPKVDKEFYRITRSKCDIQANIKFGKAYYDQVKQARYGIQINCVVDLDKLWIKKQLSDLAMISDPTACIPPPVVVEPVCIYPEPIIIVCLAATSVTVEPSYG